MLSTHSYKSKGNTYDTKSNPHTPSLNTTQRPIFQLTLIHFYGKPKGIRKRVQTLKTIQFWHFMLTLENWMCCLFMVSVLNICFQQVFHLGHQNKFIHGFFYFFIFLLLFIYKKYISSPKFNSVHVT